MLQKTLRPGRQRRRERGRFQTLRANQRVGGRGRMQPLIRTDLCSAHIYTHTYTYTCTIYVDIQNTKTQNQIIDTQLQPLTQTYRSNQRVGDQREVQRKWYQMCAFCATHTHTPTHKCAINTNRNSAQLTLIDASIIIIPTFFYLS